LQFLFWFCFSFSSHHNDRQIAGKSQTSITRYITS
jgi:hypothetical protein